MRNGALEVAYEKGAREGFGKRRPKSPAPVVRVRIRRILATTDLSIGSLAGVRYGAALADKVGAALTLLHVVELPAPPPMPGMRSVMLSVEESDVAKRARARLSGLAARLSKGNLKVTPIVSSGHPFYGIIRIAQKRRSEMIVIATHGYTGLKRVFLGSTAERVLRHAPCPVLTVPSPIKGRRTGKVFRTNLKKILVPIDFSKTSETALPWAASLAVDFHAELILLHVVEKFPVEYILGDELMNEMVTPLMKQSEAALEKMAERLGKTGLTVSVAVRYGKPFKVIHNEAQKVGADLIALTTRGYTGLKQLWLGSTAERVVRYARCPVLVVRELHRKKL